MSSVVSQYKLGDWFVFCDVCDCRIFGSDALRKWNGMYVCQQDWETQNPQDFLKPHIEHREAPIKRPYKYKNDVAIDPPFDPTTMSPYTTPS